MPVEEVGSAIFRRSPLARDLHLPLGGGTWGLEHLSGTRMAAVRVCFASHAQPCCVLNGPWCGCLRGELSWLGGGGDWDPSADDLEAKVYRAASGW